MADYLQASFAVVTDAARVRLAELGRELLRLEAEGLATEALEEALNDLHDGLETLALGADASDRTAVLAYLIETYGLLAVATDPLLRPLLPTIPATGATVRHRVRGANGKPVGANNKYIASGAVLVPAALPANPTP